MRVSQKNVYFCIQKTIITNLMKKFLLFFALFTTCLNPAAATDYRRGGDVSTLNYVESLGAKFYDADGTEKDVLDILTENGVNIVRLRLYNNPGAPVTCNNTTYKLPEGYLDEADVLALARRAKAKGLHIELTFHYSDFWTNGENQFKPKDWQELSLEGLKTAVYDYTKEFLQKMKQQDTTPAFISLGNEIQDGMLFGNYQAVDSVNGQSAENLAALINEGSKAVREVCPESQVIIHMTMNKQWYLSRFVEFFTQMQQYTLDYDVVGVSYYPYWTDEHPSILSELADGLWTSFQKPLMMMEVGYSWTQYRPSGRNGGNYEGQLHMNGTPYNEASKEGQKKFMQEINAVVEGNSHILGYLYWDPIMVDQQVGGKWIETCWAYRQDGTNWWQDGNVVGNTTWFDYGGKALPVLEAIKQAAQTSDIQSVSSEATAPAGYYDLSGRRIDWLTPQKGIYIYKGKKVIIN